MTEDKLISTGWQPINTAPKNRHILILESTDYSYRVDYVCWAASGVNDTHNWMTLEGVLLPNKAYQYWMDVPELSDD